QYRPVHAEALAEIARALASKLNPDARREAEGLYFDALDIAEAERHDQLVASIWSQLVLLALRMDPGTQQAHTWWRRSAAAVRRIGNTAPDQAQLHYLLGEIYYRDSKYAEAAKEDNSAIAFLRAPGADSSERQQQLLLTRSYDALARALEPQGQFGEAVRLYERALTI